MPLFCAAWTGSIAPKPQSETDAGSSAEHAGSPGSVGGAEVGHVVFGGGGGDRKNGVKNLLVLAHYDFGTDVLSEAVSACLLF